jgi:hypothetical protein
MVWLGFGGGVVRTGLVRLFSYLVCVLFFFGRASGSRESAKRRRASKGGKSATESASGNGSAVARTSSSERFNRIYNLAKSQLSGVKDFVMPKQSGDRRRGVIEVRCRVLFFAFTCSGNF